MISDHDIEAFDPRAEISMDALILWASYFLMGKSKLQFGGDGAENQITDRARAALNELLKVGAVKRAEPDSVWYNREYYSSTDMSLREEFVKRAGTDLFEFIEKNSYEMFEKVGA